MYSLYRAVVRLYIILCRKKKYILGSPSAGETERIASLKDKTGFLRWRRALLLNLRRRERERKILIGGESRDIIIISKTFPVHRIIYKKWIRSGQFKDSFANVLYKKKKPRFSYISFSCCGLLFFADCKLSKFLSSYVYYNYNAHRKKRESLD